MRVTCDCGLILLDKGIVTPKGYAITQHEYYCHKCLKLAMKKAKRKIHTESYIIDSGSQHVIYKYPE